MLFGFGIEVLQGWEGGEAQLFALLGGPHGIPSLGNIPSWFSREMNCHLHVIFVILEIWVDSWVETRC